MLLENHNAISDSGYQISNSLRFQSASSQYLSRTMATPTSQNVWTYSSWVKLGGTGTVVPLLNSVSYNPGENIYFGNGQFVYQSSTSAGSSSLLKISSAVYRDPSAWYHVVVQKNAAANSGVGCIRVWVNNQEITAWATNAYGGTQSLVPNYINVAGVATAIGLVNTSYADGYLSEVNFIDGQALTPSSFGTTDPTSGQWVAKKYTGTYGTNGFYLPFSNGTSTTTLGADSSGNSNNWTLNNFTRSAGVNDCWMMDVPSGNGGASGTQPSSNYAVLNPVNVSGMTITRGNLSVSQTATAQGCRSSFLMTSGQWYWEVTNTTGSNFDTIGIVGESIALTADLTLASLTVAYYASNGSRYVNGSAASYGSTYTTNDVIGVAVDVTNNTVTFYKNGVSQGTITGLSLSSGSWYAANGNANNGANTKNYNFGQRSFQYTPPTGFKALCTANLPAATIKQGNKYMDATLYTGNGSTQTITNAGGFSPDLVWAKTRSAISSNLLYDTIRGTNQFLSSNQTAAEATLANSLTSFNSNGFSVGSDSNINGSGVTSVAWQWDAGSSTVTNTNGTISSQVRANPTAGVSVVTFTAQASGVATVGHGLGIAPKMVIVKTRTVAALWTVYHASLGSGGYLALNTTVAFTAGANIWNSTPPNSDWFALGSGWAGTGSNVAYCFSEISGFSKFGSYTGNGSTDGAFVYTGFRPKFVMIKRTDSTTYGDWNMIDTSRTTYNVAASDLIANSSQAETTLSNVDILSNGFKQRGTTWNNASGGTFIYMAFAESPFSSSNAR